MQNITYAAIISFIICNLINSAIWSDVVHKWRVRVSLISFGILSWNVGQICIYVLLMLRVYYAFKGTKYESSKTIKITFVTLLILYGLCSVSFTIFEVLNLDPDDNATDNVLKYLLFVWIIGTEVLDSIISVFLITIFTKKMTMVTVHLYHIDFDSFSDEIILNEQQKGLLNIMTKYFILSLICTISTQMGCLLLCAFSFTLNSELWIIMWIVIPFHFIVNTMCLFLTFDVNEGIYKRICKGCIGVTMRYFQKKTEKKIKRHQIELRTRLLSEGSDSAIIQNSISRDSKISIVSNNGKIYSPPNIIDCKKDMDATDLELWTERDVLLWILNIEDGLFDKYRQTLEREILNAQVSGLDLLQVDMEDIVRFGGITKFSDRKLLQNNIQKLKQIYNYNSKNQNEGTGQETPYL